MATLFSDEFNDFSISDSGNGVRWAGYFTGWDARALDKNGDRAWKGGPDYRGAGGQTLTELGLSCHEVSGGTLKLYGRQIPGGNQAQFYGYPYVGGMITSQKSHIQTYGIFDCRARFPSSYGHHWAMWLLPNNNAWPPEIDMVERVRYASGGGDNKLFLNRWIPQGQGISAPLTYYNNTVPVSSEPAQVVLASYAAASDWHDYRFIWTPSIMEWYVDGLIRMSCPNYVNVPMYFLITPEIGGSWAEPTQSNTVWPAIAEIEYVRISDLDGPGGGVEPEPDAILFPDGIR